MSKPQRGRPRQSSGQSRASSQSQIQPPPSAATPIPAERRPTSPEAVVKFEAGMRAMQEHRYGDAVEAFCTVLSQYPEERELSERVRVYLAACERQQRASSSEPRDQEERLYAATLAFNAGDIDRALRHLEAVVTEDRDHDGALYMLGVGYALRNDNQTALQYLQRAIARNPANRLAALQDEDLERLLANDAARAALEGAGPQ